MNEPATGERGTIAVVGLGYVGLPLALAFGRQRHVLGYDISQSRIQELLESSDSTGETTPEDLAAATGLHLTSNLQDIAGASVYIITVPTPVDQARQPDFDPLLKASASIGSLLKRGDIVIYESTVYPGVTEEVCVPMLEQASGLRFNTDFFCGYSPERINPGDKTRPLSSITKVTSGSTPDTARFVDDLYRSIITAGTHQASSIRVAEASKVIENVQRDVNIALMNELARIFHRMGIDTREVLAAAGTKWNFLPFEPGLVGGHCIGVDPYYLAYKAAALRYNPELILAARRINDEMGTYVAGRLLRTMAKAGINVIGSHILVLGFAFKENCPDLRNTKMADVLEELRDTHAAIDVHDPLVDPVAAASAYGVHLVDSPSSRGYDAILLAVPHDAFLKGSPPLDMQALLKPGGVIFDLKSRLPDAPHVHRL